MKRGFVLILAILLILSSCTGPSLSLNESETAEESAAVSETAAKKTGKPEGFSVGYGRANVTPQISVPLKGYGSTSRRMSVKILDKLYATCIAFCDGENTALLYTIDVCTIPEKVTKGVRTAVSKRTGVPEDLISFTATHTHSGPDITSSDESISGYYAAFCKGLFEAADAALADLSEATIAYGTVETDRLNFVRRYLLADGTYSQNNSGEYPSPIVAHESDADQEMRILYVTRKDGKDIILANWQVHPTLTGGERRTDISADLVGAFRKTAEKELDVHFAYFQGAAGNLNPSSLIQSENRTGVYTEHGKLLYEAMKKGLDNLTPVATGAIKSVHRVFTGTINHMEETPERIAQAEEVAAALKKSSDEARAVAAKYNFANYFSATALLARMKMGDTEDMDLYAFAIGDLVITTNPYEMFDTNGMALRAGTGVQAVMNFGYSNGAHGYIPSAAGYEHRGYEGTTSHFVPGTGELVVEALLDMVRELRAG